MKPVWIFALSLFAVLSGTFSAVGKRLVPMSGRHVVVSGESESSSTLSTYPRWRERVTVWSKRG